MRVLAAPTSLKGALSAVDAADALAVGLRAGGADVDVQPVADGGDGTLDVLGGDPRVTEVTAPLGGTVRARWSLLPSNTSVTWPDGGGGVGPGARLSDASHRLDPVHASSRGLGELILAAAREADSLLVCLGGTVTVDGGAGLREVLTELPLPTLVLCDVDSRLLDAVHVFAKQKGAADDELDLLASRLHGLPDVAGSGAAGGLGGASPRARRRARSRRSVRPRRDRLRPARLRRRRDGRGTRRRDDLRGEGGRRGRAPLRGGGRAVRGLLRRGRLHRRDRECSGQTSMPMANASHSLPDMSEFVAQSH